jgi:GAF domain-containing protein
MAGSEVAAASTPPDDGRPRRRRTDVEPAGPDAEAARFAHDLVALVDHLYSVAETADVVVDDAVQIASAGAGALLIPDGDRWRVAAGIQLRPLEHRYELTAGSWLVEHVALGRQGALISDTDSARTAVQGAPLASWRHMMATPVPQVGGILLLAREDDPPFDDDDLEAVASVADEAAPLLASALETRALARALWEFRDEDGSAV